MKSLSKFIIGLSLFLSPHFAGAGGAVAPDSDEMREQAIQDAVNDNSLFRQVMVGRWDYRQKKYVISTSNKSELEHHLSLLQLEPAEKNILDSTRSLAIVGASAGGLIYFIPSRGLFFWEQDSKDPNNYWTRENLLTSSLFGGIVNDTLIHFRTEIRNNDGEVLGSPQVGSFFLMVLNPAGAVSDELNQHFQSRVFDSGVTDVISKPPSPMVRIGPPGMTINNYIGLRLRLIF